MPKSRSKNATPVGKRPAAKCGEQVHAVKLRAKERSVAASSEQRPAEASGGRGHDRLRAKLDADAIRQAESAAMLIAVTRMLLDLRGRDFAVWLRSIADDFDATDPEAEHPDDLAAELLRRSQGSARSGDPFGTTSPDDPPEGSGDPDSAAGARGRPH